MTHRPVNLSSKGYCRNAMLIEDHAPAVYAGRPVLYSVKNSDRLATESTRAREIFLSKTKEKCSRDFTSFFQSSSRSNDPNYVASHTCPVPVLRQKVLPTFAMAQSLRWNPYVETSSIEDIAYAQRDHHYNCRCTSCSTKNCPSRMSSSSTLRSGSNRNNIMTFADIYTMTPKLADAACGSSTVPSTRVSETSASGSDIAIRDTLANTHIDQLPNPPRCQPIPILKNTRRFCPYNDINTVGSNCSDCDPSTQRYQEPERDNECSRVCDLEPSRVISIKSFFKNRRKKKENNNGRIIYNEGICDEIKDRCLAMPMRIPSEADDTNSRTCIRNRIERHYCGEDDNQIPHSQMINSRYHKNCKPRSKMYFYDYEEMCHIIPPTPKIRPRKTACGKPVNLYQTPPCIKLPRKVLTSQMDIDSYVNPRCQHRFGAVRCDRWKW